MARSGPGKWLPIAIPVALIAIGLPIVLVIASQTTEGGNESSPGPTTGATITPVAGTIEVKNFMFAPDDIQVQSGSTLTFQNVTTTEHSIQIDGGDAYALEGGESYEWRASTPGEHQLLCTQHPQEMKGTITVS